MKEPRQEDLEVRGLGIKRTVGAGKFRPGLVKRVGTVRFGDTREHCARHGKFIQRPPHPPPSERFGRVGGGARRAQTTVLELLATPAGAGIISTRCHGEGPVIVERVIRIQSLCLRRVTFHQKQVTMLLSGEAAGANFRASASNPAGVKRVVPRCGGTSISRSLTSVSVWVHTEPKTRG